MNTYLCWTILVSCLPWVCRCHRLTLGKCFCPQCSASGPALFWVVGPLDELKAHTDCKGVSKLCSKWSVRQEGRQAGCMNEDAQGTMVISWYNGRRLWLQKSAVWGVLYFHWLIRLNNHFFSYCTWPFPSCIWCKLYFCPFMHRQKMVNRIYSLKRT